MSVMSKQSPRLILSTLVASAAAATVMSLTGCSPASEEPKVDATVYRTVSDCMADGHASNLCSSALAEAKAEAAKTTPTYERKEDCEEDWGVANCGSAGTTVPADEPQLALADNLHANTAAPATSHAGGGGFSPFFWGYMMGSHNSGSSYSSHAQPVYRGANDMPRLANGYPLNAGRAAVPASAFNKAGASHFKAGSSHAATARSGGSVSHGGFGSVGRAGGISS